jgi:hypothetical protein
VTAGRFDPEHQDEQRRHDRPAAHPGRSNQDADAQPEQDQDGGVTCEKFEHAEGFLNKAT